MKTFKHIEFKVAVLGGLLSLFSGVSMLQAQEVAVKKQAQDKVAQQESLVEIKGVIYEASTKAVLPGARIEALDNNQYTAMSKPDGSFVIKLPACVKSLFVSAPGCEGVIVKADRKKDLKISLHADIFTPFLSNRTDVNMKKEAEFGISTATTVETEIQNKLGADVRTITRSGTKGIGGVMFMQGLNSLNASAQPLIVLDGVIQDLQDSYEAIHQGFYNNILSGIDVNDIEKVTVLKNATALYGAKGANGVILIDTRRGHSMATRIDVTAMGGISTKPRLPQMMNAEQYRIYANELMGGIETNQTRFPFLWDHDNYYYNMYHNQTDWSSYVYDEAWSQNYRVNVQGGDEAAMYNFSVGYNQGENTIKSNDFNRLNIRFNTDINLSKRLKTRFDIAYSRVSHDLRDDGIQSDLDNSPMVSPGFLSLIKSPFLSPFKYSGNGQLSSSLADADNFAKNIDKNNKNNSFANPLAIFEFGDGTNKNTQEYTVFDVTVAPTFDFGKGFSASAMFNYTLHRTNEKYFRPMTGTPAFTIKGLGVSHNEVRSFFSKESSIYADAHVDWKRNYGNHNFNVFAGIRYSNFAYDASYQACHNTGNDKLPDVSSSYDFLDEDGDYNVWRNMAWFANADYNYRNKYFLQGTVTAETSSRFGRDIEGSLKMGGVCWGVFPSVQAAWLVSSEPWFNTKVVNYLKLSAGFDISGNDNISNNAAFSYFSSVQYQDKAMGITLANIENQAIQWETTKRTNVGLDAIFFNNSLKLSGNFFYNQTDDLLTLKQLHYLTGLDYYWCNGGAMKNIGFDANLTAKLIDTKNWKWELGASTGFYRNEITALPDGMNIKSVKDGDLYGYTTNIYNGTVLSAVGQPAGVFFGYQTDGVYSTAKDAMQDGLSTQDVLTGITTPFASGDVKFIDQNNDKVINEKDRVIIGNPNPDIYGNIFTNLTFKDFTLSTTLNYSLGNDVYNYQRSLLESGSSFYNQTLAACNRWKTEGDVTNMPKATYGDPKGNNRFSDRWIEDGSYLRIKDVTLTYRIPVSASWLQGISVWCTGTNLFTFTKYLGSDPEFSLGNNVLFQGIDNGLLAQGRSFHLGVKINL